jgi:putative ABC transport system ATP-binding protein
MIEARDLTKTYRMGSVDVHALSSVSFRIERGEAVAIMGQSGSGKSTLMNIMGCLDLPTSGQYIFNDRNMAELKDDELARVRNQQIGFVFQQFNLLPRATIRRNVELPMYYAGMYDKKMAVNAAQRAEEMLTLVGLGERLSHRPMELSGGEQQRVAIARSLINQPNLILADEPTGNLDTKTGAEIINLLMGLNQSRGLTLVIVTHDPGIAAHMQRVIHLRDGMLVDG